MYLYNYHKDFSYLGCPGKAGSILCFGISFCHLYLIVSFENYLNLPPQVVTLATYVFFIFTVIGRQKIDTIKKGEYMRSGRMPMDIDLYIPIFTILQFYFYMGLLKVRISWLAL